MPFLIRKIELKHNYMYTSAFKHFTFGWLVGWVGLVGLGWVGLGWVWLGWVELGWIGWLDGLGWVGLGWVGLGWLCNTNNVISRRSFQPTSFLCSKLLYSLSSTRDWLLTRLGWYQSSQIKFAVPVAVRKWPSDSESSAQQSELTGMKTELSCLC